MGFNRPFDCAQGDFVGFLPTVEMTKRCEKSEKCHPSSPRQVPAGIILKKIKKSGKKGVFYVIMRVWIMEVCIPQRMRNGTMFFYIRVEL